MKIRHLHAWDVSPKKAIEIQKRLRSRLDFKKLPTTLNHVAGADVSFSKKSGLIWAGVVVYSYPELKKVEEKWIRGEVGFPYIPGLLSFRELPVLIKALKRLEIDPELILCDGQGIAHPRGLGLASHLGLLVDRPTIGCAKSRLVGEFSEVGVKKGSYANLWYNDQVVGTVVRTRQGVKPLFISPGNKITLDESVKMVLSCCGRYRMPEPTRQAHLLVSGLRRRQETA
ncbi:MAG: deoxyribonuclease V [Deltaproteobacteria bacterium]|nr:MAG: deoxyribonuclease V [Deltaproteobacteria bacterium]